MTFKNILKAQQGFDFVNGQWVDNRKSTKDAEEKKKQDMLREVQEAKQKISKKKRKKKKWQKNRKSRQGGFEPSEHDK